MKKSKFAQEQMVRILKEVETGAKVVETCRKHRISEPTYCVWKSVLKCFKALYFSFFLLEAMRQGLEAMSPIENNPSR